MIPNASITALLKRVTLGIAALTALNVINPSSNRTSHVTQHQSRHKSVNLQCRHQLQHKGHRTPRNPEVQTAFPLQWFKGMASFGKVSKSLHFIFIPLIQTSSCCIYCGHVRNNIFLVRPPRNTGVTTVAQMTSDLMSSSRQDVDV